MAAQLTVSTVNFKLSRKVSTRISLHLHSIIHRLLYPVLSVTFLAAEGICRPFFHSSYLPPSSFPLCIQAESSCYITCFTINDSMCHPWKNSFHVSGRRLISITSYAHLHLATSCYTLQISRLSVLCSLNVSFYSKVRDSCSTSHLSVDSESETSDPPQE